MNFIGVDLAWKKGGETAIAVLNSRGSFTSHGYEWRDADIASFVDGYTENGCLVGVDAPLVVPNDTGRRRCEDELQSMGIPSYPANRSWLQKAFGAVRGETLLAELQKRGIRLVDSLPVAPGFKGVMEVYPHSTLKTLLPEIPAYKKGPKAKRLREVMRLLSLLEGLDPPLQLPVELLRGETGSLKSVADLIDAGVAAYTVYICYKDPGRCLILGNKREGFVLLPRKP
jgi:predicted RNase H-like nuclease